MTNIWDKLPKPKEKEYDEFGHHRTDPAFCAYTFQELVKGTMFENDFASVRDTGESIQGTHDA